jgi:hypothetical protein
LNLLFRAQLLLEELARMLEANVRSNLRDALARNPAARVASWTLKRGAEAAERLGPAAVLFPWLLPAQVAPVPCPRAPSPRSLRPLALEPFGAR